MALIRSNAKDVTKQLLENKSPGIVLVTRRGHFSHIPVVKWLEGFPNTEIPIYQLFEDDGDREHDVLTIFDYLPQFLPAVLYFNNGEMTDRISGFIGQDEIDEKFRKLKYSIKTTDVPELSREFHPAFSYVLQWK